MKPYAIKSPDRRIQAGFVLALGALLGIGSLLLGHSARQVETLQWVSHTREVLAQMDQLVGRLSDAENGRRGYVLAGQDRYLNHVEIARRRALEAFRELRRLTLDNPRRIRDCARLALLMVQRLEILDESIAHREARGLDLAEQLAFTERGQAAMEPIRQLTARMVAEEHELLRARQNAARQNARTTTRFAATASVASLGGIVWVYTLLQRENRRRRQAEEDLQGANGELETRVATRTAELTRALAAHELAEAEVNRLNEDLEKRVRERTRQLEASNHELEAFSYSVSHDLRAPLRHIDGFVDLLRQETNGQLPAAGQRCLRIISDSARQMGALIDDLLVYSRMGRAEARRQPLDMRALVEEVIHETGAATAGRRVEWVIGSLPTVEADRGLLKLVWANLVDNALKYSRSRDPARIEIASERREGAWAFTIKDNGAGFDPAYAHKLFGVFQRLHKAEEFEGTGIGLANVRRSINRHGGQTWADGQPGTGATIGFTLPDQARLES